MKAFFLSTSSFVTLASGASQRAFLGKTEDKVEQHLAIVNPEGDAKNGDEEYASWLETSRTSPKLHANIAGQTQVLQRAQAQIKEQEAALQKQADDARKAARNLVEQAKALIERIAPQMEREAKDQIGVAEQARKSANNLRDAGRNIVGHADKALQNKGGNGGQEAIDRVAGDSTSSTSCGDNEDEDVENFGKDMDHDDEGTKSSASCGGAEDEDDAAGEQEVKVEKTPDAKAGGAEQGDHEEEASSWAGSCGGSSSEEQEDGGSCAGTNANAAESSSSSTSAQETSDSTPAALSKKNALQQKKLLTKARERPDGKWHLPLPHLPSGLFIKAGRTVAESGAKLDQMANRCTKLAEALNHEAQRLRGEAEAMLKKADELVANAKGAEASMAVLRAAGVRIGERATTQG
eukprot:g17595.t1